MSNMSTNETMHITTEVQLKDQLNQMKLIGEHVYTNLLGNRGKVNTHLEILDALRANGFDEKLAKTIKPEQAFSRASACKTLKKNRVIDLLKDDKDDMLFQFSKKFLEEDAGMEAGNNKQFVYPKEVKVMLDKNTGEIICKDDSIRELAQRELDRCLQARTTSDVNQIATKLLESNADTLPLAVGSWFVKTEHKEFVNRVQSFLKALGRDLGRLPIPTGTEEGDHTLVQSVVNYVESGLEELDETVNDFGLSTRPDTLTKTAEKYSAIQNKLESFATIMDDLTNNRIREQIAQKQELLRQRIEQLAEDRKTAPVQTKGNGGLLGHSVSSVMHYLGKNGWAFDKAKKAVMALGDMSTIKESSLRTFWSDGKNIKYSKPAPLTDEQVAELEAAASTQQVEAGQEELASVDNTASDNVQTEELAVVS